MILVSMFDYGGTSSFGDFDNVDPKNKKLGSLSLADQGLVLIICSSIRGYSSTLYLRKIGS